MKLEKISANKKFFHPKSFYTSRRRNKNPLNMSTLPTIIISLVLAIGILPGCGGKDTVSENRPAGNSQPASTAIADEATSPTTQSAGSTPGSDISAPDTSSVNTNGTAAPTGTTKANTGSNKANPSENTANADTPAANDPPVSIPASWYQPTPDTTWQWQLQGNINAGYNVALYDIDLFDSSPELIKSMQLMGRKVICYFSAGSYEKWRDDAPNFKAADLGKAMDGWPDERWLNIRSANVRQIMTKRLDIAKEKGCDGVEPDNIDAYTNDTGLSLTAADQLDYNRFLAKEAHQRGLAIGLKNNLEQAAQLVDDFDFIVNEQCHEYNECDLLKPFITAGKPAFNVEYDQNLVDYAAARKRLCSASQALGIQTLILPLNLDDSFRFSCDAP